MTINDNENVTVTNDLTVGDDLEARQRHYNKMSEFYPNIKKELREALNLPLKRYGGGSVRMTRNY